MGASSSMGLYQGPQRVGQTNREPFPEDGPMRVGAVVYEGRADPELVAAYVARKRQIIAGGVTDSLDYCYAKGESVREVLAE